MVYITVYIYKCAGYSCFKVLYVLILYVLADMNSLNTEGCL